MRFTSFYQAEAYECEARRGEERCVYAWRHLATSRVPLNGGAKSKSDLEVCSVFAATASCSAAPKYFLMSIFLQLSNGGGF